MYKLKEQIQNIMHTSFHDSLLKTETYLSKSVNECFTATYLLHEKSLIIT